MGNEGKNQQGNKPSPSQKTGWDLPQRAPEAAVFCKVCGEPMKKWGAQYFCVESLKKLASGWKE
jgi:hypothetical protein